MYRKVGILAVLVALAASCFYTTQTRADSPPYIQERNVWSQAVATGADILTSSLSVTSRGAGAVPRPALTSCTYRFTVAVQSGAADSVLYLRVTNGTSQNFALNGGTVLTNGNIYTFAFNASAGLTYNFRVGTNTTIGLLTVDRSDGGN